VNGTAGITTQASKAVSLQVNNAGQTVTRTAGAAGAITTGTLNVTPAFTGLADAGYSLEAEKVEPRPGG